MMQQQHRDHESLAITAAPKKRPPSTDTAADASSPYPVTTATPEARVPFPAVSLGKAVLVVFLSFFLGLAVYSAWTNTSLFDIGILTSLSAGPTRVLTRLPPPSPVSFQPITCPTQSAAGTCKPPPPPPSSLFLNTEPSPVCPGYFRYIHDDLKPWSEHGITRQLVESAKRTANFRLTVVAGRAYVTKYSPAFQTRDVFTWWGVVQLLRRYPGRMPDVDLMFDADDRPVVRAGDYPGNKTAQAPPLFRYCKDNETLDIPFPDWSFWGWPEINIKPWEPLFKELEAANRRLPWSKRDPHAFWRGNPYTSWARGELMKCNVNKDKDWNARLFTHDWVGESHGGYKHSNLADQCDYRYKIYIDGVGWSVSQKYIMACDSMTLRVDSRYIDFFTRGLEPLRHYWPIGGDAGKFCPAIEFAVDWGNQNKGDARAIGKEASDFMLRQLRMEYVYDYMFHVLSEYSKLLRYRPEVPPGAEELCAEGMMCSRMGLERGFMEMSMVNVSATRGPCTLPAPLDAMEVEAVRVRGNKARKQVEMWGRQGR